MPPCHGRSQARSGGGAANCGLLRAARCAGVLVVVVRDLLAEAEGATVEE